MVSEAKIATILIADDHQLFNDGLRTLLTFEGSPFKVIEQVYSGSDVIPAIHLVNPDLVLLDINLPNRNGLDIARQVASDFPSVQVVIISMYSYRKFVDELKKIGVAGYLLKSASKQELIACLQNVMKGIAYFDATLNGKSATLHQGDDFVKKFKLSSRELEIIVLMKQGLATPEIAIQLFLSEETVKTHRKNIYYKLKIKNLAELIRFVSEQGI
ncbi:response regulator transcription factor [Larkinella knui]|uniref:DNA-binding response regulator n=1 Tax=Larkinella knui TaxID=2025310 RepID=A0A3P1CPJ3_9BACT|nr:response regulator transcription factor [Larkinella knui]RRB15237.1 DNA-binding response regulator [Larkinella knui]